MSARLGRADMIGHANEWIAAWNRRELGAVLGAFHEASSFRSPRATALMGSPLVEGRPAMERYWRAGLARLHTLDFTLLGTICDAEGQTMLVHYLANLNGTTHRACELFQFESGRKIYAEAMYGDAEAHVATRTAIAVSPE